MASPCCNDHVSHDGDVMAHVTRDPGVSPNYRAAHPAHLGSRETCSQVSQPMSWRLNTFFPRLPLGARGWGIETQEARQVKWVGEPLVPCHCPCPCSLLLLGNGQNAYLFYEPASIYHKIYYNKFSTYWKWESMSPHLADKIDYWVYLGLFDHFIDIALYWHHQDNGAWELDNAVLFVVISGQAAVWPI